MTETAVAPPRETPAQRRIVQAALEQFAEHGYHGTATRDIAVRAGVAEGTVFKYFRTKKALLIGAVAPLFVRAVAPLVRRNLDRVVDAGHPTFEAMLRALVADRLDFVAEHPAVVRVILQEFPFHDELRAALRAAVFDDVFPRILAAVARFQRLGQVAPMPPERVARIVASVFVGYVVTRLFLAPGEPWDDAAEADAMVTVLARGFAPAEAR